jgi:hypothetical protein
MSEADGKILDRRGKRLGCAGRKPQAGKDIRAQ